MSKWLRKPIRATVRLSFVPVRFSFVADVTRGRHSPNSRPPLTNSRPPLTNYYFFYCLLVICECIWQYAFLYRDWQQNHKFNWLMRWTRFWLIFVFSVWIYKKCMIVDKNTCLWKGNFHEVNVHNDYFSILTPTRSPTISFFCCIFFHFSLCWCNLLSKWRPRVSKWRPRVR